MSDTRSNIEKQQIYYNTVGKESGLFKIKGQFNTQKEALDFANELNENSDFYYDWCETLIEEPKQESEKERSYTEEDMISFANFKFSNMMKHSDSRGYYLGDKKVFNLWLEQFKKH
jgi:hypothetical protein